MRPLRPRLVAHADWSTDARKRWLTVATRNGAGFQLEMPRPVGNVSSLLPSLQRDANGDGALVAFDFPIGLPLAYAERVGVSNFLALLPRLGQGKWAQFYEPATSAGEITLHRPFYPHCPGGTCRAHLSAGLGGIEMKDLLRECERGTGMRSDASALFWTLGGKQVGKATIVGWRDVIAPALRSTPARVGIWPFDGDLTALLSSKDLVIAEAYPAEACITLGLPSPGRRWSKRKREDRKARADRLLAWTELRCVAMAPALRVALTSGFPAAAGEDQFDSLLGVMAAIEVLAKEEEAFVPASQGVRTIEGWILGQGNGGNVL